MATTNIHAISSTLNLAIDYCQKDKTESLSDIKEDGADRVLAYTQSDKTGEVTYKTLTSLQNCYVVNDAYKSFQKVIENGKGSFINKQHETKTGKEYIAWHLVQSFDDEDIDPRTAHEIGVKFAKEMFPNFSVSISTHTNTEHLHNHFVICAWDLDGNKWNNDNANYNKIRACSDKLCEEYGLNVLEETRKSKQIEYVDKDGKKRRYEPTERKNKLISEREDGVISTDDISSYRNSEAYKKSQTKDISDIQIVKNDIDYFLPFSTSYEDLLSKLKSVGYEINDKKVNGDWLKHITFKPPTADKGVRDYRLGSDDYYTRENLEQVIANNVVADKIIDNQDSNIAFISDYDIATTDYKKIDERYRASIDEYGNRSVAVRGRVENSLVVDIKDKSEILFTTYDTSVIAKAINNEKNKRQRRSYYREQDGLTREQILVKQIQDSYANLKFVEDKNIYSVEQVNATIAVLWGKYNQCLTSLNKLDDVVSQFHLALQMPNEIERIQNRISENSNNEDYLEFEHENDLIALKKCEDTLRKFDIDTPQKREVFESKVRGYSDNISRLERMLNVYKAELQGYDNCVSVLERIDRERKQELTGAIGEYHIIKTNGEKIAEKKEQEQTKKKQKHER